ncbi:MAG: EamA family transporter [Actinomycetota bacterium]|nr:EamA family transporter [Actinomycetota bacterium]
MSQPQAESGFLPWTAFGACCAIWGSTFLFISIGKDDLPPVWSGALRLGLAAVILTVVGALTQGLPRGAALRAAALYGFFGFGVNFPLLYWAEQVVPSGLAAVFYSTIPLSTAFLARAYGLERLTPAKVGGALIGLAGVVLIFSSHVGGDIGIWPLVALVVGPTAAALGGVMLKRGPHQAAIGANAVGAAAGFVISVPVSLLAGERIALPSTLEGWVPVAYLTLAGSVGAYVLFAWLIQRWPATRASFITLVIPIVAVALGAAVRDEALTPITLVGSLLVLVGVGLGVQGDRLLARRRAGATAGIASL